MLRISYNMKTIFPSELCFDDPFTLIMDQTPFLVNPRKEFEDFLFFFFVQKELAQALWQFSRDLVAITWRDIYRKIFC